MKNELPPEFAELFNTLKPKKDLTDTQKLGLELLKLAKQFPKNEQGKG